MHRSHLALVYSERLSSTAQSLVLNSRMSLRPMWRNVAHMCHVIHICALLLGTCNAAHMCHMIHICALLRGTCNAAHTCGTRVPH